MVLTKAGSILGPIATVLGYVMDILFRFTSSFGVFNVGLCIILFTIVMKTLMIPLTIKQQKTTKHHVCHESGDPGDPEEV